MSDETKRCATCGTVRPLSYFAIDRNSSDGHKSNWVACSQPELWGKVQAIKSAFSEGAEPGPDAKRCYTCHAFKDVSQFSIDRTKPDGLNVNCDACIQTGLPEPPKGFFATISHTLAQLKVLSAMKQAEREFKHVEPGPEKMELVQKRIEEILKIGK